MSEASTIKVLLLIANQSVKLPDWTHQSDNSESTSKAGYFIFHPERNNILPRFIPLVTHSWSREICHISDFGLLYIKDSVYLIGGYDNKKRKMMRSVRRYDFTSGSWFYCAKMKQRRSNISPFWFDDKIIIAGGIDERNKISSEMEIYEPILDVFYPTQTMPIALAGYEVVKTDSETFIIGGLTHNAVQTIFPTNKIWQISKAKKSNISAKVNDDDDAVIHELPYRWTCIESAEVPIEPGIYGHRAVFNSEENRVYLFGGSNTYTSCPVANYNSIFYIDIKDIWIAESNKLNSTGRLHGGAEEKILWKKKKIEEFEKVGHGLVIQNNKIFCIGGTKASTINSENIAEENQSPRDTKEVNASPGVSLHSQAVDSLSSLTKKSSKTFSIGYYDWRRKFYRNVCQISGDAQIDLSRTQYVMFEVKNNYRDFQNDRQNWMLQWHLW